MSGDAKFDLWYLLALAGAVLIGAVLPVLPTGAAVSAGAVLASHNNPIGLGGAIHLREKTRDETDSDETRL